MSYSWLRESGNESLPVTQGDLRSLEDYADRLFAKVGVDVEFTRHFLDRVNDSRNEKQINVAELIRIFKQEYKYYGKKIAQLGPDAQAVMKDMRTDVNIPFVLQWDSANNELDLIAKTVMRKKNFKTSNPEFTVEEFSWTDEELDNTQAWQELYGDVVVEATNMFEELDETAELYVDMDGVLADFFGEWAKLVGVNNWKDIKDVDSALNKIKEQPNFWVNLPLTSNALQLLSAIKAYKGRYNILSAPLPGDANSKPQKMAWIKKNLSSFPPQKIILDHNKAKYAKQPDGTPNGLIDDYGKNIASWTAAGGIAIKHENSNVQHTIDKLDDYIGEAETLKLPNIDVGDEVMVGKFKNRKATVKGFDKDDHNQPVLKTNKGDQKLFKPRISKLMKVEEATLDNEGVDLVLPRGKIKVLKAEDKDYDRGVLIELLEDGGYDMAYWYDEFKTYPVEVLVDGISIKKDAKKVTMKYHPELKENNDYSFLRDDAFDAIPRFINKITKPKTYAYAVELLHSILQRKEKEGLHHSLGYYAQSVANTVKGADWRNLVTLYLKHYGDQAVVTEADLNENGIITSQNTTDDVKPGEIQRQAKKLGMSIDSKGSPPLLHKSAAKNSDPNKLFNLGLTEDVNYVKPQFDVEWEEANRYTYFNKLGQTGWEELASTGKVITLTTDSVKKISNTGADGSESLDDLEPDKVARLRKAMDSGTVEMPIVVKQPNGSLDLVAGNTRLIGLISTQGEAKVWLVDASELSENK